MALYNLMDQRGSW